MKRMSFVLAAVLAAVVPGAAILQAADAPSGPAPMARDAAVALARSAAPDAVAKGATVMVLEGGQFVEAVKGTNGFTCFADDPSTPKPDPMCVDPAGLKWVNALLAGEPEPATTVPGIGYMARGGQHYEKDGRILMDKEDGATLVDEPPHWMLFWHYSAAATGLPSLPGPGGVYVMWDGTPYAHLMIYQDPTKLK